MKHPAIIFVFLFLLLKIYVPDLYSQSTYTKYISTVSDEYPEKIKSLHDGSILLISHRGDISENFYESFFNYTNILYKMNFELNVADSLQIDTIGNYRILIKDIINSDDNGMLVWATALNIETYDIQLCLIWFDNGLNIVNQSIYGLADMDEVISDYVINQYDQLVFVGSTDIENYNGDYILWEFDLDGTEINKQIYNNSVPSPPTIVDIAGSEKYHINSWFDVLQFDYDFNFEIAYSFSDTLNVIPNEYCKSIDDFQYLRTGTYLKPPIPGSPWEMDMAFVLLDENASILDVNFFGEEYVLDNAGKLDFITTDTIYFAGTKNLTNNPPEDSWISLCVTNLTGEIIDSQQFGEAGQNAFYDIFALPNGGYVIAGTVWDFYNYPDSAYQRDILIVTKNYGSPFVNIDENINPNVGNINIYPNPGSNQIKISSSLKNLQIQLYDYTGGQIIERNIEYSSSVNTSDIPPGIYFYKILQDNRIVKIGKWVRK